MAESINKNTIEKMRKRFAEGKTASDDDANRGNIIYLSSKENNLHVHFLTEPDGWVAYRECWVDRKPYFVTNENQDEFKGEKIKEKWMANVIRVDTGEVCILDMGPALATAVFNSVYERKGTIMGFDVEVYKTGSGLHTEYYASKEDNVVLDYDQYELFDLDEVLSGRMEAAERRNGSNVDDYEKDDTSVDEPAPAKRTVRRKVVR